MHKGFPYVHRSFLDQRKFKNVYWQYDEVTLTGGKTLIDNIPIENWAAVAFSFHQGQNITGFISITKRDKKVLWCQRTLVVVETL